MSWLEPPSLVVSSSWLYLVILSDTGFSCEAVLYFNCVLPVVVVVAGPVERSERERERAGRAHCFVDDDSRRTSFSC